MKNIVLPFEKEDLVFKWQDEDKIVVWVFLKIEKSLITKDYFNDHNIYIEQVIFRFNKDSDVWHLMKVLYNVDYFYLNDFID